MEKDGNTITESDTDQSSRRAQELSKRIKDVVLQVINEEKRVSGSLIVTGQLDHIKLCCKGVSMLSELELPHK